MNGSQRPELLECCSLLITPQSAQSLCLFGLSDPGVDVSGPAHLASDSDSEVYCDSVDQFGEDEASNSNRPKLLETSGIES